MDFLYFSGAHKAFAPVFSGIGAMFMLHHVRPGGGLCSGFAPNSGLEITPEFLDETIKFCKKNGYDLVSLAEAVARIESGGAEKSLPFACFTLDDGYRDNYEHAWPVFKKHDCPFTIFITPKITDGACELWWKGLEDVIAGAQGLKVDVDGVEFNLSTGTDEEKQAAFNKLYWPVRKLEEHRQREWIREFCGQHGVDLDAMCMSQAMNWSELRKIAADPLCTIGAHTMNHFAVARLEAKEALQEAVQSADRIEKELGARPKFFAYPYGDEGSAGPRDFDLMMKAGFKAAVTTRKGMIYPAHAHHMTALPRMSLNGGYQKMRYVDVLLSGAPFALWNRFRQVNVS